MARNNVAPTSSSRNYVTPLGAATSDPNPAESAPVLDAVTIGRRIRRLRQEQRLTLAELGRRIGRAASQVSMIENGRREPKLSALQAIAAALDVTLQDLLSAEALTPQEELEIGLERYQRSGTFSALRTKPVRVSRALPTDALD